MDFKKVTRERIRSNSYGKFDLLDKILPRDTLLNEKLWVLRWMVAETLEIDVNQIQANSLSMWRKRYKEKSKSLTCQNSQNNWRNFEPTDPDTLKAELMDINKLIIPVTKYNGE